MADLQVSLALLLENQVEIARELEAAGGKAGADFSKRLSEETNKALDELVNRAGRAAREVGLRFSRENLRFETVSGEVVPQKVLDRLGKLNKGFDEARKAAEAFAASVQRETEGAARSVNLLESAITGVAVSLTSRLTDAAGTALGSVKGLVQGFLELDGELRLAAAAAGEQGGYQRLSQIVDKVGIDAAGTTKQVAELATSLVRAGFSVSEVEGALSGVVRGAEATGTGFQSFGEIVGNTLRGFGLEVDQTARVVDVLTNTANSSNASIEGLGYTFQYTAPIAKALGVSLEDVAAAAGLMANAGIQGSVAGTGLRTGLQKLQQAAGGASPEVLGLVRGQERLQRVMAQLGTTVVDSSGKLLPMEQVFLRLKTGLESLNQADQVQLANVLFGDEAGSKFLAVTNQSSAAITKMFGDIRSSAGATNVARDAMVGMGLELQQLQGTMDSLGVTIGGVIAAGLRPLVGLANAAAGAVSGLPGPVKTTGAALVGLGIAATGASVSIGALNLVMAQVGGYAALRASIAGVAGVITGPLGAGAVILLGVAAALGVVSGTFRETDRTTKTLIQTSVGLGVAVTVLRGIAVAQGLWNERLKVTAALQTLITGLSVKGLGQIALAAGAGALAYAGIGKVIQEAGQDTAELSDKARTLKDQIKGLQDQIAEQRRLGLDTTSAEQRLASLVVQLQEVETPLDLKLDIRKAQGELKTLRDQLGKLGEQDPARVTTQASIEGLQKYKALLEAMDKGGSLAGFSRPLQEAAQNLQGLKARMMELTKQKVALPLEATAQRDQIDQEVSNIQQRLDKGQALIRLRIDEEAAMAALAKVQQAMKNAPAAERDGLLQREERLILQIAGLREREVIANRELLQIGQQQLATGERRRETDAERLAAAKGSLEVEQIRASLADRIASQDTARLRTVQQVADAYANLASAQAALTQSGFDVERSRNSNRLSLAEKELQFLRDRGASAGVIQAAEERIAAIKRDGEAVEFRSMQATIAATAQRFEIERRVLELKQAAQVLEQQNAIRTADQDVLRQRQQLLELRGKLADPNTAPAQKDAIGQQIALQRQSIDLALQKGQAERETLERMGVILGLERMAQEAQQQTAANQQRAAAAGKGWEETLGAALGQLDQTAGGVERLATQQRVLVGTIQAGTGPAEAIYATVQQLPAPLGSATTAAEALASGFAQANDQALTLLETVSRLAKAPAARWAGGGVEPGGTYQVNELGTESFLSRSGALSLIHAPAYGSWSPPSAGMVLPAGLTARLDALGAFDGGGMVAPRLAGIAPPPSSGAGKQVAALGRLQRSIDRLEGTMRSYRPEVTVNLPGNAGLLHTLQGFR